MMAHHDRSIRQCVIALAEEEGLSDSTASEVYSVPKSTARSWLQKYHRNGQDGRCQGIGSWCVSSAAQDAALVAETE
jgi:transposase